MATNRYRRSRAMRPELSQDQIDYFRTGIDFVFFWENDEREADWEAVKDDILADWIREKPGTRPWAWWRYDAPRWEKQFGAYFDGTLPEPRKRLGGIGTPKHECLAFVPSYDRGIPARFVSRFDVEYYNGRMVDIHGKRIGTEYEEGQFPYQAIDPADRPVYESEASFLKRHRLFLPDEEKRLTDADFEPEVVTVAGDE